MPRSQHDGATFCRGWRQATEALIRFGELLDIHLV